MILFLKVQLRELQQTAEDLQVKLEEQRRRKHEAERLKEHTLRALGAQDNGECLECVNLP